MENQNTALTPEVDVITTQQMHDVYRQSTDQELRPQDLRLVRNYTNGLTAVVRQTYEARISELEKAIEVKNAALHTLRVRCGIDNEDGSPNLSNAVRIGQAPSAWPSVTPTHRCKVCGALWKSWHDGEGHINVKASWTLLSATCGKCCDNVAMNEQIEPLQKPAPQQSFQDRVKPWMMECFGEEISADTRERNHRFFEESTELVQSCGMSASEAHQLVDYVYGRPIGDAYQEVGGVMVTLAALCLAQKLNMHDAGEMELARIWTKIEKIRAKQAAKPKHSPLPVAPHQPLADALEASLKDHRLTYDKPSQLADAFRCGWWAAMRSIPMPLDMHSDDAAVTCFAAAMKTKMAAARRKGRSGWDDPAQCTIEYLQKLLCEHLAKGDPVDVGNFAMMLFNRDASTALPERTVLTCAYCGHEYPQDTPAHGSKVLTDHINVCTSHPLRKAANTISLLRSALAGLIGADTEDELRKMEAAMIMLPAPEADKAVSIAAIHALLVTCAQSNAEPGQS